MVDNVESAILRIKNCVNLMRKDDRFTVKFEEYSALSHDTIIDWQHVVREEIQNIDYVIPQHILDVYSYTGGFELQWTFDIKDRRIAGTCRLSSLFGIYQRDDEAATPMRDCIKIARPF